MNGYVSEEGWVNYDALLKRKQQVFTYVDKLGQNTPDENWSRDAQLAYYINLYNAATLQLILQNYPTNSIMDIKPNGQSAFDVKFIPQGEELISLNDVEQGIIRPQFKDARTHFALVCAAVSCPRLLNYAYTEENVQDLLEEQTIYFLQNPLKNKITDEKLKVSMLFKWYAEDFGGEDKIIKYINQYHPLDISKSAKLEYLDYNWNLNIQ